MKLRILNVLTKTAPTIPQTPHTDLKYPYVPKMAIRTHCASVLTASRLVTTQSCIDTFFFCHLKMCTYCNNLSLQPQGTVGPYGHFRDIGVF